MKRLFFLFAFATASIIIHAAHVSENDARQVADKFFSTKLQKSAIKGGPSTLRLACTAENGRFYVFDRGTKGGFVVVAGDDRLPQVLGYGDKGDFTASQLPPSVEYWMYEMNRQIAFLQEHNNVTVHHPAKRAEAVGPLLTTMWDQDWPYNIFCPTYTTSQGETKRAVTGCVATATAQVMNYHKWPQQGRGSHSYICQVDGTDETELSADFSQSTYQWDLMLDRYDESCSEESCEAVARLMSDVGISMDMGYGSSSGAWETDARNALVQYFRYTDKSYLLHRDNFSANEWDELLVKELSSSRPVIYCGANISGMGNSGHAFVLDGFDTDGYFHVNWGWGGYYDGYFLVSALAPIPGHNYWYQQDGIFGLVPESMDDDIEDVMYIHCQLKPVTAVVPLGINRGMTIIINDFGVDGKVDTAGYEVMNGQSYPYALIPMSFDVYDKNGVKCNLSHFTYKESLDSRWGISGVHEYMTVPKSLEEGEYLVKLSYSLDDGVSYNHMAIDTKGQEAFLKMIVKDDKAYLYDCVLSATYSIDSFNVPVGISSNQPITVEAIMSNHSGNSDSKPVGNVCLALMKDGEKVASSELYVVMIPYYSSKTYQMQITAPEEWGRYELVMIDESGYPLQKKEDIFDEFEDFALPLFVLPACGTLVEDFESMTANSSTSDKDVQGNFTTWSFNKSGVRAPGEDRCNGEHAVMLKKTSTVYTAEPLAHNYIAAQAIFFNQTTSPAKYTLEYSFDGGITWQKAGSIQGTDAVEVLEKSRGVATWMLNVNAYKPVNFRIAMIAGTGSTYVDDFSLYYVDTIGDVNLDGDVNISDLNAVIDMILKGMIDAMADVNGDGAVNIADVNFIINQILK
jgi:hypothetical protein